MLSNIWLRRFFSVFLLLALQLQAPADSAQATPAAAIVERKVAVPDVVATIASAVVAAHPAVASYGNGMPGPELEDFYAATKPQMLSDVSDLQAIAHEAEQHLDTTMPTGRQMCQLCGQVVNITLQAFIGRKLNVDFDLVARLKELAHTAHQQCFHASKEAQCAAIIAATVTAINCLFVPVLVLEEIAAAYEQTTPAFQAKLRVLIDQINQTRLRTLAEAKTLSNLAAHVAAGLTLALQRSESPPAAIAKALSVVAPNAAWIVDASTNRLFSLTAMIVTQAKTAAQTIPELAAEMLNSCDKWLDVKRNFVSRVDDKCNTIFVWSLTAIVAACAITNNWNILASLLTQAGRHPSCATENASGFVKSLKSGWQNFKQSLRVIGTFGLFGQIFNKEAHAPSYEAKEFNLDAFASNLSYTAQTLAVMATEQPPVVPLTLAATPAPAAKITGKAITKRDLEGTPQLPRRVTFATDTPPAGAAPRPKAVAAHRNPATARGEAAMQAQVDALLHNSIFMDRLIKELRARNLIFRAPKP